MPLSMFYSITYVPAEYLEEHKGLKQTKDDAFPVDTLSTPR